MCFRGGSWCPDLLFLFPFADADAIFGQHVTCIEELLVDRAIEHNINDLVALIREDPFSGSTGIVLEGNFRLSGQMPKPTFCRDAGWSPRCV